MTDCAAPLRDILAGPLPRISSGEQELLDLADPEHLVDTVAPLYQLAPWEIRQLFAELARRNPHPHQQLAGQPLRHPGPPSPGSGA